MRTAQQIVMKMAHTIQKEKSKAMRIKKSDVLFSFCLKEAWAIYKDISKMNPKSQSDAFSIYTRYLQVMPQSIKGWIEDIAFGWNIAGPFDWFTDRG